MNIEALLEKKKSIENQSEALDLIIVDICIQLEACKKNAIELEQRLKTLRSIGIQNLKELKALNSQIKKIV